MSETLIYVSNPELDQRFAQGLQFLQQARYKQAVRILEQLLQESLSLIDRLHVLAQRALAQALWKKLEAAIADASEILAAVAADTHHLCEVEIDWEYEQSQDVGHLAFLGEVYQLRGLLYRLLGDPRRAVEDLSLALYMNPQIGPQLYLHRGCALIEVNDCLERACADLNLALEAEPEVVQAYFRLPHESGRFELHEGQVRFQGQSRDVVLNADKVKWKKSQLGLERFALSRRFGLL